VIKLVVCDVAGTTLQDDNVVSAVICDSLRQMDFSVTKEQVNRYMGMSKGETLKQLLLGKLPALAKLTEENLLNYYRTADIKEVEGTTKVFEALRDRGVDVALNTGFNRKVLDSIIDRMNWKHLLLDSIASDEVQSGRPYPFMIHRLCNNHRISCIDVCKVGDTPADIQEGISANCGMVVGTTYGTSSREEMEQIQRSFRNAARIKLIDNIDEILDIIDEENKES